jgi:hypothetical protein
MKTKGTRKNIETTNGFQMDVKPLNDGEREFILLQLTRPAYPRNPSFKVDVEKCFQSTTSPIVPRQVFLSQLDYLLKNSGYCHLPDYRRKHIKAKRNQNVRKDPSRRGTGRVGWLITSLLYPVDYHRGHPEETRIDSIARHAVGFSNETQNIPPNHVKERKMIQIDSTGLDIYLVPDEMLASFGRAFIEISCDLISHVATGFRIGWAKTKRSTKPTAYGPWVFFDSKNLKGNSTTL